MMENDAKMLQAYANVIQNCTEKSKIIYNDATTLQNDATAMHNDATVLQNDVKMMHSDTKMIQNDANNNQKINKKTKP